ncbi:hypothetical protein BpHYR1_043684 [Brachionus plicatilis]|uniref:Uncharacterized protein n=1 Tax=Brachionus plicatilis TaxID=10195 RepID=A0A3M7RR32_BRAPC|nr:hypothetical protein BpHYR1_043684 [Brachionus plicatilis]
MSRHRGYTFLQVSLTIPQEVMLNYFLNCLENIRTHGGRLGLNLIPFLYFLEPYLLLISSLKDFALFGNLNFFVFNIQPELQKINKISSIIDRTRHLIDYYCFEWNLLDSI